MLVFFDESGDNGFKIGAGSSPLLTVAMVVFEDHDEAQATDDRIALLRHELHKGDDFEFHFKDNSHAVRRAFFEAVAPFNFFYFSFVIDKTQLREVDFASKDDFYQRVCGLIFEAAKPYLDNAVVKMDSCGSHAFQSKLKSYLKKRVNDPDSLQRKIRKVSAQRSSGNNLIQLADMICGAVARAEIETKKEAATFYRMIKHRQIWLRRWPE